MNGAITIILNWIVIQANAATLNQNSTTVGNNARTFENKNNTTLGTMASNNNTGSVTIPTTFNTNSHFDDIFLNSFDRMDYRRQNDKRGAGKKNHRSTSSSSGEKALSGKKADSGKKESLEMTEESSIAYSFNKDKDKSAKKTKKIKLNTESSLEYQDGWRKWHRRCYRCPEMELKYRDPTIKWICGAYQRARRSFKSLCMMHFRNCQDGTMFVKIADHRCPNTTGDKDMPRGNHFFYDYKAPLDSESIDSATKESGSSESSVSNTFSITQEEEEKKNMF